MTELLIFITAVIQFLIAVLKIILAFIPKKKLEKVVKFLNVIKKNDNPTLDCWVFLFEKIPYLCIIKM